MLLRNLMITAACSMSLGLAVSASAGVSDEEAAKLGSTLTPVGAERSGNADGSIPAWNDKGIAAPASYVPGSGSYPDPYADDDIILTIDASNWQKYADNLTEGTKALFEKFGGDGFRLDVYPSHRDFVPVEWIQQNTLVNAKNASLTQDGQVVAGNIPGHPFPIPKAALEVLWNHMIRPIPNHEYEYDSYYVTSAGKPILSTTADGYYWMEAFEEKNRKSTEDIAWLKLRIDYKAPARRAGEILLVHEPGSDFSKGKGRKAWQYLTGQRRVRLAPAVAFDTPNPAVAGTSTYDDSFIFNGSPERYNWTLLGKKEMYIPYNNYKFIMDTQVKDALGEKFIKPEFIRWEKHRVWVVEANLREGKRHSYSKRRLYIDEDTWGGASSDAYDARGNLWRVQLNYPINLYDQGLTWSTTYSGYDVQQGIYNINTKPTPGKIKFEITKGEKFFTPKGLARGGIR